MAQRKPGQVPLERALSKLGLASRTDTQSWIKAGRLGVNGRIALNPLALVTPEKTRFTLDGEPLVAAAPTGILLAFHKPRDCTTTARDEKGRTTVFDVLHKSKFWGQTTAAVRATRWLAVGRLDLATTGLLLFTDDTKVAAWLTDPETALPRRYVVTVRGEFTEEARVKAGQCRILKASRRESHVEITLTEGKNREIRRLMEGLGYPDVTRLLRVAYGGLELGELSQGEARLVPDKELQGAFPEITALLYRSRLPSSGRRDCR
jgi:23S rRNA pseudouridine2605 synthase